jgi:hypothetical protein
MYRINVIDRSGNRMALNWDGTRDEMFALAQKISSMTGAPLLDQTAQTASTLDQVVEMAKNLGLPLGQATLSTPEPPAMGTESSSEQIMMDTVHAREEPTTIPAAELGEEPPTSTHRDPRNFSVSELSSGSPATRRTLLRAMRSPANITRAGN